jgi:prepilin-type N-terminal cleavage/methylation domain-containing protein
MLGADVQGESRGRENFMHGLVYEEKPSLLRRTRSRRGFTLIELLVVVAIIAVIAALLLPALKDAKETAKQAVCLSNLKQLFLTFNMYMDDHNGIYPVTEQISSIAGETGDYYVDLRKVLPYLGWGGAYPGSHVKKPTQLYCPAKGQDTWVSQNPELYIWNS